MLSVRHVTKKYWEFTALTDVSLEFRQWGVRPFGA